LDGRYRVGRQLGEGGMATVYLAEDFRHGRKVALKALKPELAAVVGAERFLAEIRTTANLQHPHILPLHDSGEADKLLFHVMPHVAGDGLRARLDRERRVPVDEAIRIATAIAQALDYAHRHGVVHRDVKPEEAAGFAASAAARGPWKQLSMGLATLAAILALGLVWAVTDIALSPDGSRLIYVGVAAPGSCRSSCGSAAVVWSRVSIRAGRPGSLPPRSHRTGGGWPRRSRVMRPGTFG
jgi:hypothetical protein